MKQRRWADAKKYAEPAAETWAGWAMTLRLAVQRGAPATGSGPSSGSGGPPNAIPGTTLGGLVPLLQADRPRRRRGGPRLRRGIPGRRRGPPRPRSSRSGRFLLLVERAAEEGARVLGEGGRGAEPNYNHAIAPDPAGRRAGRQGPPRPAAGGVLHPVQGAGAQDRRDRPADPRRARRRRRASRSTSRPSTAARPACPPGPAGTPSSSSAGTCSTAASPNPPRKYLRHAADSGAPAPGSGRSPPTRCGRWMPGRRAEAGIREESEPGQDPGIDISNEHGSIPDLCPPDDGGRGRGGGRIEPGVGLTGPAPSRVISATIGSTSIPGWCSASRSRGARSWTRSSRPHPTIDTSGGDMPGAPAAFCWDLVPRGSDRRYADGSTAPDGRP